MLDVVDDFPLLAAQRVDGQRFVYLDSAATTQKPACVIDALANWYRAGNANPHRGVYHLAKNATDLFEASRKRVAEYIHGETNEVVFLRNATEALNFVATTYGRKVVGEGDEIVIPISEHHSNFLPWQRLAREQGARLVFLLPDANGRLSEEEIEQKIGPKTKIVACAQVGNVFGTELPLRMIADRAHKFGATCVFDCTQGLLHSGVNVKDIAADFVALSAHKALGPLGVGVLWGRSCLLESLEPPALGGEMVEVVGQRRATYKDAPLRFEAGTQDGAAVYAFAIALDYLEAIGQASILEHERVLTGRLLEGLAGFPQVKVYGNRELAADRRGIVSFNLNSVSPLRVAKELDRRGIALRAGTHCAQPLMVYLRTTASCRASVCIYNSIDDIDFFLDALKSAFKGIALQNFQQAIHR